MGWVEVDCPNCNGTGVTHVEPSNTVDMKKLSKGCEVHELSDEASAVSTAEPFSHATQDLDKKDDFMERVKAASDSRGTKRAR